MANGNFTNLVVLGLGALAAWAVFGGDKKKTSTSSPQPLAPAPRSTQAASPRLSPRQATQSPQSSATPQGGAPATSPTAAPAPSGGSISPFSWLNIPLSIVAPQTQPQSGPGRPAAPNTIEHTDATGVQYVCTPFQPNDFPDLVYEYPSGVKWSCQRKSS